LTSTLKNEEISVRPYYQIKYKKTITQKLHFFHAVDQRNDSILYKVVEV